jgi:transposase-like protein
MSEFEEITSDNEISEAEQSTTATATTSSSKKRTSKVYNFYTLGDNNRWHCKNCRQVFLLYLLY